MGHRKFPTLLIINWGDLGDPLHPSSASRFLARLSSDAPILPYFNFHRYHVAGLTPWCRLTSFTDAPASASFKIEAICVSVNRLASLEPSGLAIVKKSPASICLP